MPLSPHTLQVQLPPEAPKQRVRGPGRRNVRPRKLDLTPPEPVLLPERAATLGDLRRWGWVEQFSTPAQMQVV